jgi:hypothetical protein
MIFGIDIDPKLIALFVACVVLLSLIAVEGFAQYKSYTDMLRAKYGLATGSASLSPAELKMRTEWESANVSDKADLYKAFKSGELTLDKLKSLITPVGSKMARTGSYLRDITDYRENPADSPDWDKEKGRYNYRYETVYNTDKIQYINQPIFEDNLRLTQGKVMGRCDENDIACMRLASYGAGRDAWNALSAGGDAAPYQANILGGGAVQSSQPAPMTVNAAGFPTTVGGSEKDITKTDLGRCILDCVYNYGGVFTEKNIMSCTGLCQSKNA